MRKATPVLFRGTPPGLACRAPDAYSYEKNKNHFQLKFGGGFGVATAMFQIGIKRGTHLQQGYRCDELRGAGVDGELGVCLKNSIG
jgi:hypothetical protein